MKRLTAVVTAAASTGLATAALGMGMMPAFASTQAAARPISSMAAHAAHVAHVAHLAHTAGHGQAAQHGNAARRGQAAAHKQAPGSTVSRQIARAVPATAPVHIPSQYGSGQYVSVVDCQGAQTPPPVRLAQPNTPLHLTGTAPTPAVAKAMATRGRYKTVYTCTVVVQKQVPTPAGKGGGLKQCELGGTGSGSTGKSGSSACHKPVTLNTGFGGAAGPVAGHHPR